MALKPIQILINAKDNASGVFDTLQKKVAAVGVAVLGYFGIRSFFGAVQGAADLEQAMSRVQAATGATAEEMAALRKSAEDAGSSSIFTSTEAAAALENLAKAGLTAQEAITALPAVMSLAQAGDVELATSAEFVTKAVMGMGLAFEDAGRVADVLAKGANATNTSVTGLAQALSYAAPVAQSLGLSLEETVAIIGKFADAGIDASRAGTALNSILSQFSNPASKFRSELAAAGITTTDFGQALEQLAASGPRGQKAVLAVGQEAGPALRALLNQGIGSLHELQAALEGSAGSAEDVARTMQGNLKGAITGLGSAWDTVKNTLGTPVLPVLKDGVDKLATALRGAVADGTIGKFGEAIAASFKSGIEWVRQFVGAMDFKQVAADMRAFADRTKEAFDEVGRYATTAGDSVKLAYGVMSAGANVVLTSIYALGTAFAATASTIVKYSAMASEALAKIAITDSAKKKLQDDAAAMREALVDLDGVTTEFVKKSNEAMDRVAAGAKTAGEGWVGLTTEVGKAAKATDTSTKAMADMAKQMEVVAQKSATAQKATEDKKASDEAAAKAVKQLQSEYRDLIASGDLQGAAQKINEINKALRGTPTAAGDAEKAAQDAADAIAAAFASVGIKTKAELEEAAATARNNFELIKQSGQATAEGLQLAFQKYAEAAIEANGGIATETLKSEAAMRGLSVTSDATGKAVVSAANSAARAVGGIGSAAHGAASDFRGAGQQMIKTAEDIARANAMAFGQGTVTQEQIDEANRQVAENAKRYGRPGQYSTQKTNENNYDPGRNMYGRAGQDDQPRNGNGQTQAEFQRSERLAGQNAVDNTLAFELRDKLRAGALTADDADDIRAVIAALDQNEQINRDVDRMNPGAFSGAGMADRREWQNIRSQLAQQLTKTQVGRRVTHNIRINDDPYEITTEDERSSSNLEAMIARLARDKRRSA